MPPPETSIPILTEVIRNAAAPAGGDFETVLAEVQTRLAARTFKLTDELLRSAFAEMEATLFEQISAKLRERLPEVIDATLREYFELRTDQQGRP
jgi:hypothetical protein